MARTVVLSHQEILHPAVKDNQMFLLIANHAGQGQNLDQKPLPSQSRDS